MPPRDGSFPMTSMDPSLELLDFLPDAAVVVDPEGTIARCNARAAQLFGWVAGELEGQPIEVLIPPESRTGHEKLRGEYAAGPRARSMGAGLDLYGLRADGSRFPVDVSLAPVSSSDGTHTVAIVRDLGPRMAQATAEQEMGEKLRIMSERDRIARDLHDRVIQRIFATGLGLQAAAGQITDDAPLQRVRHAIDELDAVIRELRTSIFELESRTSMEEGAASGLRERILEVASRASEGLGFMPSVRFAGPVEIAVPNNITDDVLAVVREGLSNVAKYAAARRAEVSVAVLPGPAEDEEVVVTVEDDGRGIGKPRRSSGLDNLRSRAVSRGGVFSAVDGPSGGTVLEWRVPLD